MENIIVAITGASGVVYARRLLQVLIEAQNIASLRRFNVHLIVSEAAVKVIEQELGLSLSVDNFDVSRFIYGRDSKSCVSTKSGGETNCIIYHRISDIGSPIASGGFPVKAMIIVPCSINTLSAIANGIASNLIERAASVTLKEGRKLVLVPRETPLTAIHIENMLKLANAQACLLPAMPGFYHNPKTIDDLINFVVAKILNYLKISASCGVEPYWMPELKGW
ncbi:MAG: UbiX family flavin prenyltransferase [Candidatus Brocadiales bacterium]